MIPVTLVLGANARAREAAIATALDNKVRTAVLLEGLPDGLSGLDDLASGLVHIVRIAPACMCCTGNLTMRVTLNRILRGKPQRIYIALATADHLANIRTFLSAAPYGDFLQLTEELHA